MRLYKETRKWSNLLQFVILSVAFRIIVRVECVEYRTFDIVPDGSRRMAQVIAVPVQTNQFASRKGSLDIRSQYWTRSRRDPEYSEEPDVDADGVGEEEEVGSRHAYVQVDRSGKEHTLTINMPRMEGRGGRNHLIKKFVLQPVIQYVVQYDKDSQKENGDEIQAQGTTNFEDYEGYEGQEKMVRGHGKSVERFFNDIDAKFETHWGNDGNGQGGQGYQEQGDNAPGDGGGGYQDGGGGGGGGGYQNGEGQAGFDGMRDSRGGGGYENRGNSGGSQEGYNGNGGQGGPGGYDSVMTARNQLQLNGNNHGGYSNAGGNNVGGDQNHGRGGATQNNMGSSQGGNGIAHDFGYTIEGETGGYSAANQFHQPPDVNAYVSTGGYGVPQGNPINAGGNGGGMINSAQQQFGNHLQAMNANAGGGFGVHTGGMNSGHQQSGQMYSAPGPQNTPSVSVTSNGLSGMTHASSHAGQSGSASFGSMQGMSQGAPAQTMGMVGGTSSNNPAGSLNSLYGVPGMTPGRPLGMENAMMMNAMNGGAGASGVSMMTPTTTSSMMGMMQPMQGQMAQSPAPASASAAAGSSGMVMMNGGVVPMQSAALMQSAAPMTPGQMSTQTVGMGGTMGMGGTGSSSTIGTAAASTSASSSSSGMNLGAQQMGPMGMGAATGVMGPSISEINSAVAALMAMGASGGATGASMGGASGVSMAFGVPRPSMSSMAGSMSMGHLGSSFGGPNMGTSVGTMGGGPSMGTSVGTMGGGPSSSYGAPSAMSGAMSGSPSAAYGPPKESMSRPPSSSYGPPAPSMDGYGGSSSTNAGGYSGSSSSSSESDCSGGDDGGSRGKAKKPSSGGGKMKGGRGGKSFLSSLPLPKIPQSIGGHLSFMFSTGVGKGRRNRGGGMSGGGAGGGGKPGGDKSKGVNKEQVSDHILTILGLSAVHQPPYNNASLANSTTNPILLWEQNGNRTSLNHTSNPQEEVGEDTLGDVVDLLPVDKDLIPDPTPTVDSLNLEPDVTHTDRPDTETTTTTEIPSTTTVQPTEGEIDPLESKPSNKILIATIQPSTLKPSNKPSSTSTTTAPPTPKPLSVLNKSILIATVPPSPSPSKSPMPPILIATVTPPSTQKPLIATTSTTMTTTSTSTTLNPTTLPVPSDLPATTSTTSQPIIMNNTTPATYTTTTIPSTTTFIPTFTSPLTPVTNQSTVIQSDFTPRVRARPRQGKHLPFPLIATPPPPPTAVVNYPSRTPPPLPTPSISIEFDPIQDYINHNISNVLNLGSNSQRIFPPHHYSPPPRPKRPPNIQAYYAEHNLNPNPIKIPNFDPLIYEALQAAFHPQYNNLYEDGRKKKRSRFPAPLIRSPFPFPFPLRRSRTFFGRFTDRLSKKSLDGRNDTLAVIPSTSVNILRKDHPKVIFAKN